jgi:hypothetical protein
MDYNPFLSVGTAALEISAAVWALRGPGRKPIVRTTAAILFFLAAYQIIEAALCTGIFPMIGSFLPRLAFIVVAWLPPTGLLLVAHLYPTRTMTVYRYAYGMFLFCLALVVGIAIEKSFVTASVCMIVFARYTNPTPLYGLYGLFYQGGLMSMLFLSAYGVTVCDDHRQRLLLGQVLLGCLAFIFPSLVTIAVIPVADNALPSIMCHFALLLAAFLVRLLIIERRGTLEPELGPSIPAHSLG